MPHGVFYLLLTSHAEYRSCSQSIQKYLADCRKIGFFFIFGQPFEDVKQIAAQYQTLREISKDFFYYADHSHCYKITGKETLPYDGQLDLLQQTQDMLNAILTSSRSELTVLLNHLRQYLMARRPVRDAIG